MFDCFCRGITVALRTGAYDLATTTGCIAERVLATDTSGIVVVVEVVLGVTVGTVVVVTVGTVVVVGVGTGSSEITSIESEY